MAAPGRVDSEAKAAAQKRFLGHLQSGVTVREALRLTGRTENTYEQWRRESPEFKDAVARIRRMRQVDGHVPGERLSFPVFSERYLGARVFGHMQNVVDLIEGVDPSWLHPSMTFLPGERDLIMVNMPPEHAKTTSITVNYAVFRICMDPNVRIIVVSKTQEMAKKMLYAIKTRLTHPA